MKIEDIDLLLGNIRDSSGLDEFVVIGSLWALGLVVDGLPPRMTRSMEVDAYPERDPERAHEFAKQFGENSAFHHEHGYYFNAVSPDLPTQPAGREHRMLRHLLPCGVTMKYLDPNDCVISKYARSEPKDREWIRAGIEAGILSLPIIKYRMRETRFMDDAELAMAKVSVAADQLWFQGLRGSRLYVELRTLRERRRL